jgi:hypothetical protein
MNKPLKPVMDEMMSVPYKWAKHFIVINLEKPLTNPRVKRELKSFEDKTLKNYTRNFQSNIFWDFHTRFKGQRNHRLLTDRVYFLDSPVGYQYFIQKTNFWSHTGA